MYLYIYIYVYIYLTGTLDSPQTAALLVPMAAPPSFLRPVSPGADVAGVSPFPVQMLQGWAQARPDVAGTPSPGAVVTGSEPSPRADMSPVLDADSMRSGRGPGRTIPASRSPKLEPIDALRSSRLRLTRMIGAWVFAVRVRAIGERTPRAGAATGTACSRLVSRKLSSAQAEGLPPGVIARKRRLVKRDTPVGLRRRQAFSGPIVRRLYFWTRIRSC